MMGQIGMQPHPAAVAAAIQSRDRIMIFGWGPSIDAQIPFAAEFDRGAAHVDTDTLRATRAQPPQFSGCEGGRDNGGLGCRPDGKRRRQYRLGAGEIDRSKRGFVMSCGVPNFAKRMS
jgi:hypothetical protein